MGSVNTPSQIGRAARLKSIRTEAFTSAPSVEEGIEQEQNSGAFTLAHFLRTRKHQDRLDMETNSMTGKFTWRFIGGLVSVLELRRVTEQRGHWLPCGELLGP